MYYKMKGNDKSTKNCPRIKGVEGVSNMEEDVLELHLLQRNAMRVKIVERHVYHRVNKLTKDYPKSNDVIHASKCAEDVLALHHSTQVVAHA